MRMTLERSFACAALFLTPWWAPRGRAFSAINRHTIEIWGQKQAIAYFDGLALTAKKLAAAPKIGKARDDLARGLCAFPYQSHIMYFLEEKKSIVIARVFHERMRAELYICASGDRSLCAKDQSIRRGKSAAKRKNAIRETSQTRF